MTMASMQDIPERPKTEDKWTFKRLFPFGATVSAITKTFTNPFDILLGYMVFVLGVAELINRTVSGLFYILIVMILAADIFERYNGLPRESEQKENKK